MKKVICVAAAFLMVAGVATVASAEVSLSGSARARIRYNDDGVKDGVDKWDSRLRIKINATTEGGGYAKGRIRLLDGTWGLGNDYTPTAKGDGNVWSDYAFVGFKKGNIDVAAGKMPTAFSAWFSDDERRDRFRVKYTDGGLLLAFTYDKRIYEFKDTSETIDVPVATLEDGSVLSVPVSVDGTPLGGDKDVWGISYTQKFSDTFKGGARL
ncbi:MAG TPA: porin, partial [Desulfocapsa sulfexigens]|nr:porin [Desulfocapsa sulfexigens]